jgi:cold shock CspA family protein
MDAGRDTSRDRPARPQATVRPEDFEPGTIKFRHRDGYGFVTRDGKADAYFHVERVDPAIRDLIVSNTPVLVAVGSGKRGPVVLAMRLD